MNGMDGAGEQWRTSSYCLGANQTCVQVSIRPDGVAMRHSKSPEGPVLRFTVQEWRAFLDGVRANEFDPNEFDG